MTNYVDLFDILPNTEFEFDLNKYRRHEREVLTPALQSKGYIVERWEDGERDSFGPLSRVVVMTYHGKVVRGVYG